MWQWKDVFIPSPILMEPELQERLASVVGFLETSVQSASQFAIEQAPDIIQQLLRWKLVSNSIEVVAAIVLAIAIIKFGKHLVAKGEGIQKASERWSCDGEGYIFIGYIMMVVSLGAFLIGFGDFLSVVQILIAPKIYLLEYASSLIK